MSIGQLPGLQFLQSEGGWSGLRVEGLRLGSYRDIGFLMIMEHKMETGLRFGAECLGPRDWGLRIAGFGVWVSCCSIQFCPLHWKDMLGATRVDISAGRRHRPDNILLQGEEWGMSPYVSRMSGQSEKSWVR